MLVPTAAVIKAGQIDGGEMQSVVAQSASTEIPGAEAPAQSYQNLFIPLLMTVLSQSFLTLVRRNFMTLSLFTTRHTTLMFLLVIYLFSSAILASTSFFIAALFT